jgi:tetratricopeptide (TPR) repeat protein
VIDAVIMDFGIARSTSRGGPTPAVSTAPGVLNQSISDDVTRYAATIAGEVVGTIEYMAPEQARGEHIDQRADIYAFGLMIYDMLTGRRRSEHAVSAVGELQRRLSHPPPPVRSVVPEVPQALEQLITRCTEPDAEKRFQTTTELVEAIERLDDNGRIRPKKRVVRMPLAVAVASALLTLSGYIYWATRPPVTHDPVTLVIADFVNNTGDATFDRTLEPMLKRGLDEAGFISAYDRSRIRATFGVQPPDKLDDTTTRELALKQGVGVVLAGSIDSRNNGYEIAVKAIKTVTGEVVVDTRGRASNKDQVPATTTRLVTAVRKALGDETSDSAQLLAMKSLSTTSMDVAANYAAAIAAQSNGQFEEARQRYQKTVELEPNFGLGYQGLAIMSRNLGRLQEAQKFSLEALNHLEGMTGRERLAVRASYYLNTGDYQQCAKGYSELIAQYAADAAAHSNRAGCLSKLRNMREAVDGGRHAVEILPKRATLRANLAMLASYAGEFQTAETEAKKLEDPTDMATLAVAFAQLGQGLLPEATNTYRTLGTIAGRGPSWMASGMGDLAVYEGRFSDAARIFEEGAAADLAAKNVDRAARKLTSMAYAHLMRGDKGQAVAAAEKALLTSNAVTIRFLAARILVEAGVVAKAKDIAASFALELPAEPQAYGKILEGGIALKNGEPRQAIKILTDANNVLDTWLAHFDLGRAYLALGAFPEAELEFERCISRRGEALSLLVDEEPTYGHFPMVYYYQGRARDGLKNAAAAASYGEYFKIRGKSTEDPLLSEVRKRAGS